MTQVLLVGDTHGNNGWAMKAANLATRAGASRIIQLGDFGYWPHVGWGQRFLNHVSLLATTTGIPWYWLDGNHENHDRLDHHADVVVEVAPQVFYMPRGYRFELEGVRFAVLGGAHSIDKWARVDGYSWWADENITDEDVERVIADGPVDVLLAHDAPAGHLVPGENASWKVRNPETQANRWRMHRAVYETHPQLVVHGHYHEAYAHESAELNCRIVGLGRDGDPASLALLTLPALRMVGGA